MTAIVKKIEGKREKRGGFVVPTIEEVKNLMIEKKGWPGKFAQYYAEKFWNNYEASGWKLSNGNSMKSWQAAFSAQWQNVRYQQDIDFLKECLKKEPVEKQNSSYLNDLLLAYKKQFDSVPQEALIAAYDFLKSEKKLKLTLQETELIRKSYSNNIPKGKAACVTTLFSRMINNNEYFK